MTDATAHHAAKSETVGRAGIVRMIVAFTVRSLCVIAPTNTNALCWRQAIG
jgi:hypothetical protein